MVVAIVSTTVLLSILGVGLGFGLKGLGSNGTGDTPVGNPGDDTMNNQGNSNDINLPSNSAVIHAETLVTKITELNSKLGNNFNVTEIEEKESELQILIQDTQYNEFEWIKKLNAAGTTLIAKVNNQKELRGKVASKLTKVNEYISKYDALVDLVFTKEQLTEFNNLYKDITNIDIGEVNEELLQESSTYSELLTKIEQVKHKQELLISKDKVNEINNAVNILKSDQENITKRTNLETLLNDEPTDDWTKERVEAYRQAKTEVENAIKTRYTKIKERWTNSKTNANIVALVNAINELNKTMSDKNTKWQSTRINSAETGWEYLELYAHSLVFFRPMAISILEGITIPATISENDSDLVKAARKLTATSDLGQYEPIAIADGLYGNSVAGNGRVNTVLNLNNRIIMEHRRPMIYTFADAVQSRRNSDARAGRIRTIANQIPNKVQELLKTQVTNINTTVAELRRQDTATLYFGLLQDSYYKLLQLKEFITDTTTMTLVDESIKGIEDDESSINSIRELRSKTGMFINTLLSIDVAKITEEVSNFQIELNQQPLEIPKFPSFEVLLLNAGSAISSANNRMLVLNIEKNIFLLKAAIMNNSKTDIERIKVELTRLVNIESTEQLVIDAKTKANAELTKLANT